MRLLLVCHPEEILQKEAPGFCVHSGGERCDPGDPVSEVKRDLIVAFCNVCQLRCALHVSLRGIIHAGNIIKNFPHGILLFLR